MNAYNKFALVCFLFFIGLIVAYCESSRVEAQTLTLPEAVESTPTPNCYFDDTGNFVCQSHTNDLTPTPTTQPTATNTRRPTPTPSLTPTPTSPLSTPFEPTATPAQSPTVTPTPTTIIIKPFHELFLPAIFR